MTTYYFAQFGITLSIITSRDLNRTDKFKSVYSQTDANDLSNITMDNVAYAEENAVRQRKFSDK